MRHPDRQTAGKNGRSASASEVVKGHKSNSAKFSILNLLKANLSPTDVRLVLQKEPPTCKERLNDKGKVDTSEEYQCIVSRLATLLLTQKWYDTEPSSKPQSLDGEDVPNERMKNGRYCINTYLLYLNNTVQENQRCTTVILENRTMLKQKRYKT